jgi:hypothetical protein
MDMDRHLKRLYSIDTINRLDTIFINTIIIIINRTSSIHKDGDMKIVKR